MACTAVQYLLLLLRCSSLFRAISAVVAAIRSLLLLFFVVDRLAYCRRSRLVASVSFESLLLLFFRPPEHTVPVVSMVVLVVLRRALLQQWAFSLSINQYRHRLLLRRFFDSRSSSVSFERLLPQLNFLVGS